LVGVKVGVDHDIAIHRATPAAADQDERQILPVDVGRQRRPDGAGRQDDRMLGMLAAASWRERMAGMFGARRQRTPRMLRGERGPNARRRRWQADVGIFAAALAFIDAIIGIDRTFGLGQTDIGAASSAANLQEPSNVRH
jgi:hypothetical protein